MPNFVQHEGIYIYRVHAFINELLFIMQFESRKKLTAHQLFDYTFSFIRPFEKL
jgi:hypothetical protein